jgi:hypothetical protein
MQDERGMGWGMVAGHQKLLEISAKSVLNDFVNENRNENHSQLYISVLQDVHVQGDFS